MQKIRSTTLISSTCMFMHVQVLLMEPPYQGKTRQSKRLCTKKSVGGHRKKDAPSGDVYLYDEVKFIVFTLVNRHIDITTPYEEWIKLGFALVDGLGEDGRELFHQLSSMNAEYNYEECDKKYTSCMKGNGKASPSKPSSRWLRMLA